jgi:hypothetical protein
MLVFPVRIEHALDVAVQGAHDADPRVASTLQWRSDARDEAIAKIVAALEAAGITFLSPRRALDCAERSIRRVYYVSKPMRPSTSRPYDVARWKPLGSPVNSSNSGSLES